MRIVRSYFKGWNWFEIALLTLGIVLPLAVGIPLQSDGLQIATVMIWLTAVLLYAKAKPESYIFDIVATTLYIIVAFQASLFGEFIVQAFIAMPLMLYGMVNWLRNLRKDKKYGTVVKIKKVTVREVIIVFASQMIMSVGYFFLLGAFDTVFLWVSTAAVSVGVFAMYFMARRSIVSLFGFIALDLLQIALWILIVASGAASSAVMIVLPFMLLVNDIYGIFSWNKLTDNQESSAKS